MEQILNQFSKAVLLAVNDNPDRYRCIPLALYDLVGLETRPPRLTQIAYEWCSVIYANRENFRDWEDILLVCLEVGFRHLDSSDRYTNIKLTHTEHHRGLVDVVFKSQKSEAIADLLHVWTAKDNNSDYADEMLGMCTGHLVGLHNLVPFSPRLRRLVIRSVELVGYQGFESTGVEKFTELLDHLQVTAEETHLGEWVSLLLDVIRSPEGTQRLSDWYWKLLVERVVLDYWGPDFGDTDALKIAKSLIDAEEWDKLECWIGTVWAVFVLGNITITEEDLERSTLLLFRQRPGSAQKLEQWMKRRCQKSREDVPESFQQILARAREAAQRQDVP